ncbi:MAG: 3-phosphoshikimate 1-carboxyvinyltransferase [Candidatus Methylacidiphilales bacterium]
MSRIKVHPLRSVNAELTVSGDKSISHRAVIFGALAQGPSHIDGFLPSHDCLATIHAFQALGVEIEMIDPTTLYIEGSGGKLHECGEMIDCGNSGTTMRLLSGVLAGYPFTSHLSGDASLHRRPMKRVADPLSTMGAKVICQGENGRPPLEIRGAHPLKAIQYTTPVASAQIKSALLLAALRAEGLSTITEKELSRDHTERMLRFFGASLQQESLSCSVLGGQKLNGQQLAVPGDFSSAAFWMVAAAASKEATMVLHRVGLNPTRTGLLNVLSRMGAQIQETVECAVGEPWGKVTILGGNPLRGTVIEGKEIPNVIDEIPILAVAASLADGVTTIRGAAELRVKESDRLATVAAMLRSFGVEVDEFEDGMRITGGAVPVGTHVQSHGDHRIAMAGAVMGLFASGTTVVEDTDCIATSYPSFAEHLALVQSKNPIRRSGWMRTLSKTMDSLKGSHDHKKKYATAASITVDPAPDTKVNPPLDLKTNPKSDRNRHPKPDPKSVLQSNPKSATKI